MSTIFLTSSPTIGRGGEINKANSFADELLSTYKQGGTGLFITSMPDNAEFTDGCGQYLKTEFEKIGMTFSKFDCIDNRNSDMTKELVSAADLIILSGGHVPTENKFFMEIGLKDAIESVLLKDVVIIGISAGTMNSAEIVYAQPELEGESIDPDYVRFMPGLGLTKRNVCPHYDQIKYEMLDGKRLFEDITYEDSIDHEFIALPDGSYILIKDGKEEIRGEHYIIRDGKLTEKNI